MKPPMDAERFKQIRERVEKNRYRPDAAEDVSDLLAEVERLRQDRYLPMACPNCDRRRVLYAPEATGNQIWCEKCEWMPPETGTT